MRNPRARRRAERASIAARVSRTARVRRGPKPGSAASRPSCAAASSSSSVSISSSAWRRRANASPIPGTVVSRSSGDVCPSRRSSMPSRPLCSSSSSADAMLSPIAGRAINPVRPSRSRIAASGRGAARTLSVARRQARTRNGIGVLRLEQVRDALERVGEIGVVGRATSTVNVDDSPASHAPPRGDASLAARPALPPTAVRAPDGAACLAQSHAGDNLPRSQRRGGRWPGPPRVPRRRSIDAQSGRARSCVSGSLLQRSWTSS